VVPISRLQPLNAILRDEVYRIGREALVNAVQHSRAGKIEVELEYAARRFRFSVRDNGCGIDPKVLQSGREGHWGLPGLKERAERMGGGTEVELSVPGPDCVPAPAGWRPIAMGLQAIAANLANRAAEGR
jgi:signal transduction histidine kinase